MSKTFYVFSTLSSDMRYQNHQPGGADLPVVVADVFVAGGAGIANDRLITPRGVMTKVTEQEAEALRQNPIFKMHEKNGFVQISTAEGDADKAAADMTGRDQSAPVVPQDLPKADQPTNLEPAGDDDEDVPRAKRGRSARN